MYGKTEEWGAILNPKWRMQLKNHAQRHTVKKNNTKTILSGGTNRRTNDEAPSIDLFFFIHIFFWTNAAFRLWFHAAPGARVVELSVDQFENFLSRRLFRKLFTKTCKIVFFHSVFLCYFSMFYSDESGVFGRYVWTPPPTTLDWKQERHKLELIVSIC